MATGCRIHAGNMRDRCHHRGSSATAIPGSTLRVGTGGDRPDSGTYTPDMRAVNGGSRCVQSGHRARNEEMPATTASRRDGCTTQCRQWTSGGRGSDQWAGERATIAPSADPRRAIRRPRSARDQTRLTHRPASTSANGWPGHHCGDDLRARWPQRRIGGLGQQCQRIRSGQVVECDRRRGMWRVRSPDQGLVRPRDDLGRFGQVASRTRAAELAARAVSDAERAKRVRGGHRLRG